MLRLESFNISLKRLIVLLLLLPLLFEGASLGAYNIKLRLNEGITLELDTLKLLELSLVAV